MAFREASVASDSSDYDDTARISAIDEAVSLTSHFVRVSKTYTRHEQKLRIAQALLVEFRKHLPLGFMSDRVI